MSILEKLKNKESKLAVVGLGYVGLPLAVEFGKVVDTIGFDLNSKRISELKNNIDQNGETAENDLKTAKFIEFTDDPEKLKKAQFIIIAVPTPITKNKQPDLSCLESASKLAGENLSKGSIVVFESTVYPGVTEEVCVPILEKNSGLKYREDFKVGYSPERINPGDKEHTVRKILKVVSGCDNESLEQISEIYGLVIDAGVYKAESIKCAEAAKVIENTQRDLNIALMNELSIIFNKMGIDTLSVLEAAGTKWNFIKMKPGLVGGHCIGVDPYYLTYKAEEIGYRPQVILSGRRINDGMGKYIAEQTVKKLIEKGKTVKGTKIIVLGITFKENVSDIRNSRVIDIINELKEYGISVVVCDPLADKSQVKHEYGIDLTDYNTDIKADGIVIAVNHDYFKKILTVETIGEHLSLNNCDLSDMSLASRRAGDELRADNKGIVIDIKGIFQPKVFENTGLLYWRL